MVANTLIMLLKMLKQIVPMARFVWQQGSRRTASENMDKLQNILSQRVIVIEKAQ